MVARIYADIKSVIQRANENGAPAQARQRETHAEHSNRQSEREVNPCVNRKYPNEWYQPCDVYGKFGLSTKLTFFWLHPFWQKK